jgi:hypothetical protein
MGQADDHAKSILDMASKELMTDSAIDKVDFRANWIKEWNGLSCPERKEVGRLMEQTSKMILPPGFASAYFPMVDGKITYLVVAANKQVDRKTWQGRNDYIENPFAGCE